MRVYVRLGVMGPMNRGGTRKVEVFTVVLFLVRTQRPSSKRSRGYGNGVKDTEEFITENVFPWPPCCQGKLTHSSYILTCFSCKEEAVQTVLFWFLAFSRLEEEEGAFYIRTLCLHFTLKIKDSEKIHMSQKFFF